MPVPVPVPVPKDPVTATKSAPVVIEARGLESLEPEPYEKPEDGEGVWVASAAEELAGLFEPLPDVGSLLLVDETIRPLLVGAWKDEEPEAAPVDAMLEEEPTAEERESALPVPV